ncbi:MAG: hypothetical protein H0X25_18440 [Acidobacteriales bacterium]|nr:hypothetical protein [Terriglobales bacterium]
MREFAASGLERSPFCRKHGFPLSTLMRYLPPRVPGRQQPPTAQPVNTPALVEVEVRPSDGMEQRGSRDHLTVWLSSGQGIEVGKDFDAGTLQRLVRALENQ